MKKKQEKTQRLCLSYRPTQKYKCMKKSPKTMTVLCFTKCKNTHRINNYRKRKNPTIKSKYTAIPNIVNITPQIICELFIIKTREKTKAVSVLQTHTEIQIYEKTQSLCLSYRPTQKY